MTPRGSRLTPMEIATGLVLGIAPRHRGAVPRASTPLGALEDAIVPALRRPPCVVSFSGGRDSSAILAVAASVARREGLPPPVPVTNVFPDLPETSESEWQERVLGHVAVNDWARLEHGTNLDCVGTVAATVLTEHGLLWPFNSHFHVPILRLAAGGSLLTGIGGDEMLSESRWAYALSILHGDVRPRARDVLPVALALSPAPMRRHRLRRSIPIQLPWLRPAAAQAFGCAWARQAAAEPLRRRLRTDWVRRLRYLDVGTASLASLASADDVRIVHPFLDPRFSAALGASRSAGAGRTATMRTLFGGLLPADVLSRTTKTNFDRAFWSDESRAFAAAWDGGGVDQTLVDLEALRQEWQSDSPDARSFTLLQSAWLAQCVQSSQRRQEALDGVVQ